MQVRLRAAGLGSRSLILALAVCALGPGCASSDSSGSTGEGGSGVRDAGTSTGSGGSNGSGGDSGSGLSAGRGGATGEGGTTGSGGVSADAGGVGSGGVGGQPSGAAGAGGQSSGAAGAGSGGVTGGLGGASSAGGSIGSGGATGIGGAAGGSSRGGTTGSGGATAAGGGTGSGGTTGAGGATAAGGSTGTGGATSSTFCPSGAIFCTDFEEASGVPTNRPVGTATFEDPTEVNATFDGPNGVMSLDTTAPYDGRQSLKVMPSSAAAVRALAIGVPSTFWVRLYLKSDQPIGQTNENGFLGAGTSPVFATGNYVELSEDLDCLFLDKAGTLFPTVKTCGLNAALSANVWHCLVAAFDGATGNVMVFSGQTEIINATGWAPAREAFNTFELGTFVDNPNGATVWYDDVAISAMPLTCP